jgi:hypothetical protein
MATDQLGTTAPPCAWRASKAIAVFSMLGEPSSGLHPRWLVSAAQMMIIFVVDLWRG